MDCPYLIDVLLRDNGVVTVSPPHEAGVGVAVGSGVGIDETVGNGDREGGTVGEGVEQLVVHGFHTLTKSTSIVSGTVVGPPELP